jgi:hypothetical protein
MPWKIGLLVFTRSIERKVSTLSLGRKLYSYAVIGNLRPINRPL